MLGFSHKKIQIRHTDSTIVCCNVAVLQFQNRFYESQKLTLDLYRNIEVFLGHGNASRELQHCNTATDIVN